MSLNAVAAPISSTSVQGKLDRLSAAVSRLESLPADLRNTFASVSAPIGDCAEMAKEVPADGDSDIARALDNLGDRVNRVIDNLVEINAAARLS